MFSQWGLETENAKNTPELSLTVVCENASRSSTRTSSAFGIQEKGKCDELSFSSQ